jgi:hypothetical protein
MVEFKTQFTPVTELAVDDEFVDSGYDGYQLLKVISVQRIGKHISIKAHYEGAPEGRTTGETYSEDDKVIRTYRAGEAVAPTGPCGCPIGHTGPLGEPGVGPYYDPEKKT